MRRLYGILAIPLLIPAIRAQSVISVRSGLINFSEGEVFIDNQAVVTKSGRYVSMKDGSALLTRDGRAELLLTPNAYLRIGQNSGLLMISGDRFSTQVELLSGSAILDSGNALADAPITLVVRDVKIRVEEPTRLKVDADPPQLRVYKGKAEVLRAGNSVQVLADQMFPLDGSSIVQKMTNGADDLLEIWSQQRNRLIYISLATAQNIGDPQTDPEISGGGAAYSSALDGWAGYLPLATVAPMNNLYFPGLPGYSYGSYMPYPYAFYTPYPYAFYGARSQFRSVPGYRFAPVYPGSLYPQRGIAPRPVTPGFVGTPRPVMSRPPVAMPHIAPHR
jgi:hypothetical protein